MNFAWSLRVLGTLAALLLMAGIQGERDLQEVCGYCQMGELTTCNDSTMGQMEVTVQCESCVLRLEKPYDDPDNLTITAIGPDQVCLLRSNSTADQTTPANTSEADTIDLSKSSTDPSEESVDTIADETTNAVSTSTPESLDYPADEAAESMDSFRSEVTGKQEKVSPPAEKNAIECYACSSSSDEACFGEVEKLKPVQCPVASECITVIADGHLVRNCSTAFPAEVLALCQTPNNTNCKLCPTTKCNKTPWNRCYQCTSTNDRNCTLSSASESIPTQICPDDDDVCSVRVTKAGDTVRECSRRGSQCLEGELCSSCPDALCNAGVFPENRTRCIQCEDCEAEQDPKTALPCTRFSAEEKCFSYMTAKSTMIRGCWSNSEGMLQCQASGPKCVTCSERNGCNCMPLMKDPSLSCYSCTSKEVAGCAWAQVGKTPGKCQNKVLYYLQETCMMDLDPDGKSAVRGCSFDHGACTAEDASCRTCSGDGCNAGNLKVQECVQCRSDNPGQGSCSKLAQGIPSTKCPQETQPYQTRGCFTMTKGNITTRGCIVGLSPDDVKFCMLDGQSQCNLCTDDGCNNRLAPSSGGKIVGMALLMWILAISVVV